MPATEAVTRCLLLVLLLLREAAVSAASAAPLPGGTYPPPPPPPPPPATAQTPTSSSSSSLPPPSSSTTSSAAAWAASSSSAAPSAQHQQRVIEEDEGPSATENSEGSDSDPDSNRLAMYVPAKGRRRKKTGWKGKTLVPTTTYNAWAFSKFRSRISYTKQPIGVTCYTCVNVSDNLVCNRFAIDRPCPRGEWFCHTLHIMDSRGESVVVHKKCADDTECSSQGVGCLQIDAQKICVSCCDEMYCNASVPTNHSNAVLTARRRHSHRGSSNPSSGNANSSAPPSTSTHVGAGGRGPIRRGLVNAWDASLRLSSVLISILTTNIQRFALQ